MPSREPRLARSTRATLTVVAAVLAGVVLPAVPAGAVLVTIRTADGDQEGFHDPTPAARVGRNPGTTLGEQRLYVFQYAADKWGLVLGGEVPVVVGAGFDTLGGSETGALLGYARNTTVHRDFPGAPRANTWYVAPLANQFFGSDQNDLLPADCFATLVDGNCPEIESRFNSSVDDDFVLGDVGFYYGVDGDSGGDVDFLAVVMHEIAHGLGIFNLIDPPTGQKFYGYDDAYSVHLEDPFVNPKQVPRMSDAQRRIAYFDDGELVWAGPSLTAHSGVLDKGVRGDGAVQIYAPTTHRVGSSISHMDTELEPNELMEPFINSPAPHELHLTLAMLRDIGWKTRTMPDCGDANTDGRVTTTDALVVLRSAIGNGRCPAVLCDVDDPGGVGASDALVLLKKTVGQNVTLFCPEG